MSLVSKGDFALAHDLHTIFSSKLIFVVRLIILVVLGENEEAILTIVKFENIQLQAHGSCAHTIHNRLPDQKCNHNCCVADLFD